MKHFTPQIKIWLLLNANMGLSQSNLGEFHYQSRIFQSFLSTVTCRVVVKVPCMFTVYGNWQHTLSYIFSVSSYQYQDLYSLWQGEIIFFVFTVGEKKTRISQEVKNKWIRSANLNRSRNLKTYKSIRFICHLTIMCQIYREWIGYKFKAEISVEFSSIFQGRKTLR